MTNSINILADAIAKDHWLEQLSWTATVLLAIGAMFALWQVRAAIKQAKCALEQNKIAVDQLKMMGEQLEISKADIVLRSKREAIAVALDQCKRFAEHIVPAFDKLGPELIRKGYHKELPLNTDPQFPVIPQQADPVGVKIWFSEVDLRTSIVQALNELESFAMYFANDLADESVAFIPAGQSFCHICEYYRLFIGVYRQPDKVKLYQNLVKLYGMWKPRLERTVLEEQGKLLESKLQKLPVNGG
jgi:hypothetical protein